MARPGSTAAAGPCPCDSSEGRAIGLAGGEPVFRCAACGLLYYSECVRNRPPTDSDWWAELAGERQSELHTALDTMRKTFDRQLAILERLAAGRCLIDIGAGAGLFLAAAWGNPGPEFSALLAAAVDGQRRQQPRPRPVDRRLFPKTRSTGMMRTQRPLTCPQARHEDAAGTMSLSRNKTFDGHRAA